MSWTIDLESLKCLETQILYILPVLKTFSKGFSQCRGNLSHNLPWARLCAYTQPALWVLNANKSRFFLGNNLHENVARDGA